MKILIIYKSITGFTKKYAQWLSEELNCDCMELSKIKKTILTGYDLVIYGGSLHATGIYGYKKFKSYAREIGFNKIIIYFVGASPAHEGIIDEIRSINMKEPEEKKIPLFYMRGGFDYNKLNLLNKIIMLLLKWKLMLKKNRSSDEKGMLAAYKKPLDVTNKNYIKPLCDYIKEKYNEK